VKTFLTLKNEVRAQVWGETEPENLRDAVVPGVLSAHDQHFQEAMADIAKWVRCEQTNIVDVIKFCNTFFKCGMTVFKMPNGKILRLMTVVEDEDGRDYCSAITYREVEWPEPECVGREAIAAVGEMPALEDQLALGFTRATAATDGNCRSLTGVWAKHRGNIYVAPYIQSTELILIEWDGIKTSWADEDLVNEEQDYKLAVQLYTQFAHERDYGSPEKAAYYKSGLPMGTGGYDKALAELMWTCEEKLKVRETFMCDPCSTGLNALLLGY